MRYPEPENGEGTTTLSPPAPGEEPAGPGVSPGAATGWGSAAGPG